jgi:hypothetical protein
MLSLEGLSKKLRTRARRGRMLCGIFSVTSLQRWGSEANGKQTMRSLFILVTIFFSTTAFVQSAANLLGRSWA